MKPTLLHNNKWCSILNLIWIMSMNISNMLGPIMFVREFLLTVGTFEGLFTGMDSNVILHMLLLFRFLMAIWAPVITWAKFDGFSTSLQWIQIKSQLWEIIFFKQNQQSFLKFQLKIWFIVDEYFWYELHDFLFDWIFCRSN